MARETRIGIALMMLLGGAFGFMAYQRWNSQQPTILAKASELREELATEQEQAASEEASTPEPDDFVPTPAPPIDAAASAESITSAPPSPFGDPPAVAESPVAESPVAEVAIEPPSVGQSVPIDAKPAMAQPATDSANPFAAPEPAAAPDAPVPTPAESPFAEMVAAAPPFGASSTAAPAGKTPPAEDIPPAEGTMPANNPFGSAAGGMTSPPTQPKPEQSKPTQPEPAASEPIPPKTAPPTDILPFAMTEPLPEGTSDKNGVPRPELATTDIEPFGAASLSSVAEKPSHPPASKPAEMTASPFGAAPTETTAAEPAAPQSKPQSKPPAVTLSSDPFAEVEAAGEPTESTGEEPQTAEMPTTETPSGATATAEAAAAPVILEEDPFANVPAPEQSATTPETDPKPETAMAEAPFAESPPTDQPPATFAKQPTPEAAIAPSPFGEAPTDMPVPPDDAPASADTESSPETIGHYIVQEKDNYWTISQAVYGSPIYAHALAQYNSQRIPDPRNLEPGTKIPTPALEVLKSRYGALIATGSRAAERTKPRAGFFMTETGQPAYRVSESETLEQIAQSHLGRSSRSIQIYEMNRDVIEDPQSLQSGTILKLPIDASRVRLVPRTN